MRLLDGDFITGLLLPVLGEGSVEFLVEFARWVIGNVEEFDVFGFNSTAAT